MRAMTLLLGLLAVSSVTGCVSVSYVPLGDGSSGHAISCDGRELSIETCFAKAAEICGSGGFETVTREGRSTVRSIAKGSTDPNTSPFARRSILVRCHDDKPLPRYD